MMMEAGLPPRYEIRVLGPEHIEWVSALVTHTNIFHSPVWPVVYPDDKTARLHDAMRNVEYLVRHQVESGHSLGVFDNEYQFKRDQSKATGGRLYWDQDDTEASGDQLLEQMDFALVSVALAYDSAHPLDHARMEGLIGAMPLYATFYGALERLDPRPRSSWAADKPGELLLRNATNTRSDYEGRGLMKKMAHCMMHTAAAKGFRGIQIETLSDAVQHVWANPPPPFSGQVVSAFDTLTYEEEDEGGDKVYPFRPANQKATKIYCSLKAN
ncbi:hypothetical protein HRG_002830 [Hirsutella rhossiliensis]|uniref:Uncharacterized protein n=1 Tax=Hirsutella rhossiliensis TaxID=111463 RepID=A0A9P8N2T8_9HYPO|nr:uncharacterized protein HRG_02830 [Hirsutella rhossiliensis]KAH0964814.1 hypothetical protein HRG_02830 [Hirsutella rhossiliensis]